MHKAIFRLPDRVTVFFFFFLQLLTAVAFASFCMHGGMVDGPRNKGRFGIITQHFLSEGGNHAGIDVSQTYHSAVGHGALGFAGALGALPPLWVSVRRLADLEDVPGGSGAIFAPIRCRTHAYTSTNKTALTQNGFWSSFAPHLQRKKRKKKKKTPPLSLFLPHQPPLRLAVHLPSVFTLDSPSPTTGWAWASVIVIALSISLAFLPSLVRETGQIFSQTSLGAQEKSRMSACDSSPHCLDCDGAQVTFTPAAHGAQWRLHTPQKKKKKKPESS